MPTASETVTDTSTTSDAGQSLRDRAYGYVKQSILSGRLQPGDPLSIRELADAIKISRTPMREALMALSREGLVEVFPSRGTFVSRIAIQDLKELFELREGLEGVAARLAAQRRTSADIARLEAILTRGLEAGEDEIRHMVATGTSLHQAIVEISGNTRIKRILEEVAQQSAQTRLFTNHAVGRVQEAEEEHRLIVEAIRNGDGSGAEQLLRAHMRNSLETAMRLL